jgi:hypothetical protein
LGTGYDAAASEISSRNWEQYLKPSGRTFCPEIGYVNGARNDPVRLYTKTLPKDFSISANYTYFPFFNSHQLSRPKEANLTYAT